MSPSTIEIGQIALGDEVAKVDISSDEACRLITVWRWGEGRGGKMKPGRLGVALPVVALPQFAALINLALARARAEGFLDANPGKRVSGAPRALAGGCL